MHHSRPKYHGEPPLYHLSISELFHSLRSIYLLSAFGLGFRMAFPVAEEAAVVSADTVKSKGVASCEKTGGMN